MPVVAFPREENSTESERKQLYLVLRNGSWQWILVLTPYLFKLTNSMLNATLTLQIYILLNKTVLCYKREHSYTVYTPNSKKVAF